MAIAPPNDGALTHDAGATPVHRLGEHIFDAIAEIGDVAHFSILTLLWIVRRRSRWSVLVPIFYAIGVKSVSVVAITGTFIGMVLAVLLHGSLLIGALILLLMTAAAAATAARRLKGMGSLLPVLGRASSRPSLGSR